MMKENFELPDWTEDFPPVKKEEWIQKIREDLKGGDYEKKMVWKPFDGLEIFPFYMKEDLNGLEFPGLVNSRAVTETGFRGSDSWVYREKIMVDRDPNVPKIIHEALHNGAGGLELIFEKNNFPLADPVFSTLYPNWNPIAISVKKDPLPLLEKFFNTVKTRDDIFLSDLLGSIQFDPIYHLTKGEALEQKTFKELAEIIQITKEAGDFKGLVVNGGHFMNSGGNAVQQIAYTCCVILDYYDRLTEEGLSGEDIFNSLELKISVGNHFFIEVAKLKALRILVNGLAFHCGLKEFNPDTLKIHADTALWTKTLYDPYVNMLRNTTEAMSAVLGRCNSLSILPFDVVFSEPTEFSRRISRNISNLMREEAYLDKVTDAAAGSYYIENLIHQMVSEALDLIKRNESEGGFITSFEEGILQASLAGERDKKMTRVSSRKETIIGVNQYPNPLERVHPEEIKLFESGPDDSKRKLPESRLSENLEKIRLRTDTLGAVSGTESIPVVYLSILGENKIMRKARAEFSRGFFGCAGFRIKEGTPSSTVFETIEKCLESKAEIIVLCGADEDYTRQAVEMAKAIKSNMTCILVIAGNPTEGREMMQEAGIDDFIHLKTDLIPALESFQNRLKI